MALDSVMVEGIYLGEGGDIPVILVTKFYAIAVRNFLSPLLKVPKNNEEQRRMLWLSVTPL